MRAKRMDDGKVIPYRSVTEWDESIPDDPEYTDRLTLPCGQCVGCRMSKAQQWQMRAIHESRLHEDNCFVTLTYDDEHLPEDRSLSKETLQKFLKRTRYHHGPLRYMAVGEYGPSTNRPHYHLLLFGQDFTLDGIEWKPDLYVSAALSDRWKFGFHTVGAVTPETAGYVAQYTLKKIGGKRAAEACERIDPDTGEFWSVEPEFFLMSRNPGIGADWFSEFESDCFPSDFLVDHNGKKQPVPAYYDYLLKKADRSRAEDIKRTRRDFPKPTYRSLKAKEKTIKSRRSMYGETREL
jgi:hypothetical protein